MSTKTHEDWINKKWRPAMGWMYMVVCIFDFILFPILYTLVQFWEQEAANDAFRQWEPLTLSGAGLFHMAMGAVLGIAAWSRGQEKMAGVANGSVPMGGMPGNQPVGYMLNTASYNGGYPQPSYTAYDRASDTISVTPVAQGYRGKKAPVEPEYPTI